MLLDGAGWHQTGGRLRLPDNISLLHPAALSHPNSTRWRTFGSSSGKTSSATASTTTTTQSSMHVLRRMERTDAALPERTSPQSPRVAGHKQSMHRPVGIRRRGQTVYGPTRCGLIASLKYRCDLDHVRHQNCGPPARIRIKVVGRGCGMDVRYQTTTKACSLAFPLQDEQRHITELHRLERLAAARLVGRTGRHQELCALLFDPEDHVPAGVSHSVG